MNHKHGMCKTRLYKIYTDIKTRLYNSKRPCYKNYGGRGIEMCAEWKESFQRFYDWAVANGYTDDMTIDRIDVNGHYEPSNCRWVTLKEQQNNRRNNHVVEYQGLKLTTAQWADRLGINYHTLQTRLHRNGWSVEKAFNTK